jgi:hypothetical protein
MFTEPLFSSGWFLDCDWLALDSMWWFPQLQRLLAAGYFSFGIFTEGNKFELLHSALYTIFYSNIYEMQALILSAIVYTKVKGNRHFAA